MNGGATSAQFSTDILAKPLLDARFQWRKVAENAMN